jgi:hypothetical protein
MMARVGFGEVLRESVALCRYRAGFLAGMLAVTVVFALPLMLVEVDTVSSQMIGVYGAGFMGYLFLATIPQVCVFYTLITTLRGQDESFVPPGLARRTLRTFIAEMKMVLAVAIPGMLGLLLAGFFTVHFLSSEEGIAYPLLAGVISSLCMSLVAGWLGMRLGAGVASATVGERLSFKDSWRMTRGYSVALTVSILPFVLVPQIGPQLLGGGADTLGSDLSVGMMANLLVGGAVSMFTYVVLSVWYVRLKDRHDAERALVAAEAGTGPGTA